MYSLAQDPLVRPWRSRPRSAPARNVAAQRYFDDYSSHFLDLEEAQQDKRSRLWKVDFKSRRPGALSITTRLIWANVLFYAAQVLRPSVTAWGIKLSDQILSGRQLHRLITPMFLHGNLIHLYTNMYSLSNGGKDVEQFFGPGRYLASYVVSGIAGNLLSAIQSPNPSLGASGAVFGVFGAYYVFLNRNDWLLGRTGDAISSSIASMLGINIMLGVFSPNIDNWGHLGGFIGGAAMAYLFGPRLYLSDLPNGDRILVDKPMVRLPRSIEALPERVGKRYQRITRRMQVNLFKSEMSEKPWRRKQNSFQRRRDAPNRSIKPREF